MAITVHLSEILKARGMTAKELCALVGITEANLSILRSGKASGVRFIQAVVDSAASNSAWVEL